jgi:hypothetical protein
VHAWKGSLRLGIQIPSYFSKIYVGVIIKKSRLLMPLKSSDMAILISLYYSSTEAGIACCINRNLPGREKDWRVINPGRQSV